MRKIISSKSNENNFLHIFNYAMKSTFAITFLFLSLNLKAQTFLNNREKFVKELKNLISSAATAKDMNFINKQLEPMLLETKDFPDNYFEKMVETCNFMEVKKLKFYPETFNYVFSVYSFIKAKQSSASYSAWHSSVDKMLDAKNVNKFKDFIDFSAGFFSESKLIESSNFKWFYKGGTYTFSYTDKPFIKFEGGKLLCVVESEGKDRVTNPYIDSIVVSGSQGTFYPIAKDWEGKGGVINWQKVGLPKDKTFASLKSYTINMKSPNLNADTAILTTPYFEKPIIGQLKERAFNIPREEDKVYPQFTSFERRLTIKNISEDIDYSGGFSMRGADFIGVGTVAVPAQLLVYRAGKPFIKVNTQTVIVSPKRISSFPSQVSVYFAVKDSIYHPGVEFIYEKQTKTFDLVRGKSGIAQSPFSDTYHSLDMYVPKISWVKGSEDLALTFGLEIGQEQRIIRLESKNFYDSRLYDQLQGLETVHPLVAISNYCYKYDEYVINEGKLATALGKTVEQAKTLMLQLSGLGFISYDTESKMVYVNNKTMNFINSRSGKKDFDNLSFNSDLRTKIMPVEFSPEQIQKNRTLRLRDSTYKAENLRRRVLKNFGTISLVNHTILLDAVDQVRISEPQNVAVFPEGSKISIKKDRNFTFSGWINSGKIDVKSVNANYVYETNKINLIETEYAVFNVSPLAEKDGKDKIMMGSSLTNIVGEILVDAPSNRSGNDQKIGDYPKLIVSQPCKVYYNDKSIYKGAYDSARFYFTVAPFTRDSLDNFKEKTLKLKGELTSAGIFPKFAEELKIMPDYSFGFATKAPETGYDFYSTKSKYSNKIVLSNNGLQGNGKIDFILSTSISEAFTFLPDSTVGYANFVNRPSDVEVKFPDVSCEVAYITYLPKGNLLKAASTDKKPLLFFKEQAKLKGMAILRPNGMQGSGIMNLKDANVQSDLFSYKRWDIDADTSVFNLKNNNAEQDENALSFKTENVQAHISFLEKKGVFKSNNGESKVEFPVNQYVCKMDLFTWFMDKEEIELAQSGQKDINIESNLDITKSNFLSVHPDQDSLQFRAPKAVFSSKEKTIYCSEVEYIDVADARVFPDSSKVIIHKKAKMDPLLNASIVANYITKYHKFTKANTVITARRAYTAEGDYPYIDADSAITIVRMDKIGLDETYQTIATGKISSESNFKLSDQFDYYGEMKIFAASPSITFSGATRINHSCEKFPRSWMAFTSKIDPKNIQIPVSESMKTLEGLAVSAGIIWRDSRIPDSIRLYPTFLSQLKDEKDPILITASGLLQYDFDSKEFQIGTVDKLINRKAKGNFIALNTETCSMSGDGKINLGMDYGDITVDAVGTVSYDQGTGMTDLNITARYNLPLDRGQMEKVASKIIFMEGLKQLDFGTNTMLQAITEWKDAKTADQIKNDYIQKNEVKNLPKEMETGIVITGIRLSSLNNSYNQMSGLITNTESAAIVNIYNKPVFKYVPVKAFFKQVYSENPSGDKFGLLMSIPGGSDYYLDYAMIKKEGLLQIYTSDKELEASLTAMKEDKRKVKNFRYESSTNKALLSIFMRLFE